MAAHQYHGHGVPGGFGYAVAVTMVLIIAKVVGAWWGHSVALGADAAHSLGDVGDLGFAWCADRQRHRPPTAYFTFGWGRLEVLAGLTNALSLWVLAGALGWDALQHWQQPQANAGIMAAAAGVSLVAMVPWCGYFAIHTISIVEAHSGIWRLTVQGSSESYWPRRCCGGPAGPRLMPR